MEWTRYLVFFQIHSITLEQQNQEFDAQILLLAENVKFLFAWNATLRV